jgi:hypothetical protein
MTAEPDHLVTLDIRRPFTRAEAITAGIRPSALRGPNFRRIFRDVYAHRALPLSPLVRVQAALLVHPPTAFASHASAARVYGVPIPSLPDEHVSVFAAGDRRYRPGIRNHVVAAHTPVVKLAGTRVSAPARLFLELAPLLGLVDLVVVGDALVRLRHLTPQELREACGTSHSPGAQAARRAAEYVRARVDSPMETRLRMLLVLAGLPEPTIDHRILDEDGRLLYRFDLSYPDLRILVEYDGRQHRADLDQWDHDTDRKDWLDAHGWQHVAVFSRGIYRDPAKTVARVAAALRSRGAVLPRRLSEGWRPYFSAR